MGVRITNRFVLAAVLVISLLLVVWGLWSLLTGFPNYDALNTSSSTLTLPLPTPTITR